MNVIGKYPRSNIILAVSAYSIVGARLQQKISLSSIVSYEQQVCILQIRYMMKIPYKNIHIYIYTEMHVYIYTFLKWTILPVL